MKLHKKEMKDIRKNLTKKDYVVTYYKTGDWVMSGGDPNRMVKFEEPKYTVCSLEEIPTLIERMNRPFWEVPDGLSKEEIKNYPHEKKRWGRYFNVIIEPLSEELERNYLQGVKSRFFEFMRDEYTPH